MSDVDHVIKAILRERERQDKKWGKKYHGPSVWSAILAKELGEVNAAWLRGDYLSDHNYRTELIHVAAVAVAALDCWENPDAWEGNETDTEING